MAMAELVALGRILGLTWGEICFELGICQAEAKCYFKAWQARA